jgi:hypothetical protein
MVYGLRWHGSKLLPVKRKVWKNFWSHIGGSLAGTFSPGQFYFFLSLIFD